VHEQTSDEISDEVLVVSGKWTPFTCNDHNIYFEIQDSLSSSTLRSTQVFKYRAIHFAIEFLRVEHVGQSLRNFARLGVLQFTALRFITFAMRSLQVWKP